MAPALAEETAEAMRTATGQWGRCADVRRSRRQGVKLVVATKARNVTNVHHVLADPSEEMGNGNRDKGPVGPFEARLQVKVKRQVVQWIDGPDKTGSNGVGNEDLGVKPNKDGSVGRRGALQHEVQELELKQQPASQERRKEIQKVQPDPEKRGHERRRRIPRRTHKKHHRIPRRRHGRHHWIARKRHVKSHRIQRRIHGRCHWTPKRRHGGCHWTLKRPLDPEEGTQEAPSDSTDETRKAPSDREDEAQGTLSDPEEDTLDARSDSEEEANDVAGLAKGPTDLKGPAVTALRKLAISGNLRPNNVKAHVESAGALRRRRIGTAKFSANERGR